MIINNSLDEVKKRESAFKIIRSIIKNKGRNSLYDVTGLSGGFLATVNDLDLLETYVGPAIFEEELQKVGKEHMGGEKVLGVNRTSSGILATILALVPKNTSVVHFLADFPGHPSISRSCELVGADYFEYNDINKFNIPNNTSLVVITGSTMDLQVVDETLFKKVIDMAHDKNLPVLVDDASGARLRTAVFNQKKATELGADLAVTSTDKLMHGPRGGLMAGRNDLIDQVKIKANQFGLEAQPPVIIAIVNGLKAYNKNNLVKSIKRKDDFLEILENNFSMFEKTPNGVMIDEKSLVNELKKLSIKTELSPKDCCFLLSMVLLKEEGILTIPAVGMPGASNTVRFDLSTNDVIDMNLNELANKIYNSFEKFLKIVVDVDKSRKLMFY